MPETAAQFSPSGEGEGLGKLAQARTTAAASTPTDLPAKAVGAQPPATD